MKTEMSMEEIEKLEEAARKYSGVDKIRLAFWEGAKWMHSEQKPINAITDELISKALKEHSIHTKDQVSFLAGFDFYRKNNPAIKKIKDLVEEYKTKLDESPTAFGREEFLIVELNKILNS